LILSSIIGSSDCLLVSLALPDDRRRFGPAAARRRHLAFDPRGEPFGLFGLVGLHARGPVRDLRDGLESHPEL
jgi:hypothetical protein